MNQLPAPPPEIANRQRRRLLPDASAGLGMSRPGHLSIRGGQFALVRPDGARLQLQTTYIDVVICDVLRETSRIMFPEYRPGSDDPPICWSDNGMGPSANALEPQSPICETCQWNVKGTAQTFSGDDTTACRRTKKVAFFIPDDPQVNIYLYQIGPGSFSNFKSYCLWLGQQSGDIDIADCVTRITQDPEKQLTFKFEAVGWIDNLAIQKLEYIALNKLSDVVVNRDDKACDPETVSHLLQLKSSTAQFPRSVGKTPELAAPYGKEPARGTPPQQEVPRTWTPPPAWEAPQQAAAPAARVPAVRKPRKPRNAPVDPVQAGAMAPAALAPTPQFSSPAPAAGFQPPGFVPQTAAFTPPGTRLQETAQYNPAPAAAPGSNFGMVTPVAPPQSLAAAMKMLPPQT
jgi:hypothetical protein